MILQYADNADIFNYRQYGRCAKRVFVPAVPGIAELNLFVNFDATKPSSFEIWMVNACKPESSLVSTGCYIIAYNGTYWYGVFKGLTSNSSYPQFLFAIKTTSATYFSDIVEIPECSDLTKLSVCYPNNYNAEDINGAYIGQPDPDFEVVGSSDVIYSHNAWVRLGEVVETSNKIKYVSSRFKNFSTSLVRQWELRSEMVPGWYKNILLAIYFRGNILINGQEASIADLNFEDVDVDYWKAYAILSKEFKGSFGCTPIVCAPECVCYPVGISSPFEAAYNVYANNQTNIAKMVSGTESYWLTDVTKPSFIDITLVANLLTVKINGNTSDISETYYPVSFKVRNSCGEVSVNFGVKVITEVIPPAELIVPVEFDLNGAPVDTITAEIRKLSTGLAVFSGGIVNNMPATAYIINNVLENYTDYEVKVHGDPSMLAAWITCAGVTKKLILNPGSGDSMWTTISTQSVADILTIRY